MTSHEQTERWRHRWDQHAPSYDRVMGVIERMLFRDTRRWVCSRASGDVLEVAVGTGLNLPLYPRDARLTGIDWSPAMVRLARRRRDALGLEATLVQGDARSVPFPDASFDTVVCTFSLCGIPGPGRAIAEMVRVLRPGAALILADHVGSDRALVRAGQRAMERLTIPLVGEHFVHRPLETVHSAGCDVEISERFGLGIVERLVARKQTE